jgi:hypothetical protein
LHSSFRKLTPSQLVAVLAAAKQLRWRTRERFLGAVAEQLADAREIGDGTVDRVVRVAMDLFFMERTVRL